MEALAKLFVFSLRKYMQAARDTATCSNICFIKYRKQGHQHFRIQVIFECGYICNEKGAFICNVFITNTRDEADLEFSYYLGDSKCN